MVSYIIAVIIVLTICIILILLIRSNKHKLKMKTECGEIIKAKVNSWKAIPGRPTRYAIKIEYEIDKKIENKVLITSRKFAKKYESERNIQVVAIPNSNKIFLQEEDWKIQNVMLCIFLIFAVSFLIQLLLMGFMAGSGNRISKTYTIKEDNYAYEVIIRQYNGEVIISENTYNWLSVINIIGKDTLILKQNAGDYCGFRFSNVRDGKVSETFDDVAAYSSDKVVYPACKDNAMKIIIQDIWNKDEYYMEIIRDYAPVAVGKYMIIGVEFLDDDTLRLEYYSGEDWKEVCEVIKL